MRKTVALVLAAVIALSLCACGAAAAPAEPSIGDQMYEKYGTIIDSLEAGEYEEAMGAIAAMMPEPETKEVLITPENFSQYYELKYDESHVNRDAQGKVSNIWFTRSFYYSLKEEYREAFVADGSKVSVGVTADCVLKKVASVDWETGEVTLGEESYPTMVDTLKQQGYTDLNENLSVTQSGTIALYGGDNGVLGYGAFYPHQDAWGQMWWSGQMEAENPASEYYVFVPENIQIVRAEGSITLRG